MADNDLLQPLNPAPRVPSPVLSLSLDQVLFLTLVSLSSVLLFLGIHIVHTNPQCDQPLIVWVFGFFLSLGLLCVTHFCFFLTLWCRSCAQYLYILVWLVLVGWTEYGLVLVWSSEVCEESLWIYVMVVALPLWVVTKAVVVILVLYGAFLMVIWCMWGTLNPRFIV